MEFAEPTNVNVGNSTSSLDLMPKQRRERCKAEVPFTVAITCFAPVSSDSIFSNLLTKIPTLETKFVETHSSKYLVSLPEKKGSCKFNSRRLHTFLSILINWLILSLDSESIEPNKDLSLFIIKI